MFSKACEYAIRCTLYIANQSNQGKRCEIKEIAESTDSPVAFTAKILQKMVKENIVNSIKGHGGGFEMDATQITTITVQQIVKAIDGDESYTSCFMGLKQCSESHPCPAHFKYKKIRADFEQMLRETRVEELVLGIKSGNSFLSV